MKGKSLAWVLSAALAGTALSGMAQAEEKFVTIGDVAHKARSLKTTEKKGDIP